MGRLGYRPHLRRPRTFNEKLVWHLLHDPEPRRALWADKLAVKRYVRVRTPEVRTPATLTQGTCGEELNVRNLPDLCILKVNNGWGGHALLRAPHDESAIVQQANAMLARDPLDGLFPWERYYGEIPPLVFIEAWLGADDGTAPADVKAYVVDGRVELVRYMIRHPRQAPSRETFDRSWRHVPNVRKSMPWEPAYDRGITPLLPMPPHFGAFIDAAERLADDVRFVRVDGYLLDDAAYIGELTFSPSGGAVPLDFALDESLGRAWKLGPEVHHTREVPNSQRVR